MVRATFITLKYARADNFSRSLALFSRSTASWFKLAMVDMFLLGSSEFDLPPLRCLCLLRAFSTLDRMAGLFNSVDCNNRLFSSTRATGTTMSIRSSRGPEIFFS